MLVVALASIPVIPLEPSTAPSRSYVYMTTYAPVQAVVAEARMIGPVGRNSTFVPCRKELPSRRQRRALQRQTGRPAGRQRAYPGTHDHGDAAHGSERAGVSSARVHGAVLGRQRRVRAPRRRRGLADGAGHPALAGRARPARGVRPRSGPARLAGHPRAPALRGRHGGDRLHGVQRPVLRRRPLDHRGQHRDHPGLDPGVRPDRRFGRVPDAGSPGCRSPACW